MQTALAAAEEASSGKGFDVSECRDAIEHAIAMLSLKEGKATDQLVPHQQLLSESRVSLPSASGDDSEGMLVATEDSYTSFEVRQAQAETHPSNGFP